MANYREDNIDIDNDIDDEIMRRVIEESINHTHGKYAYGDNIDNDVVENNEENDEELNKAIIESEKINVAHFQQQNYDTTTIFKQNDDVLQSMMSKFNMLKHANISHSPQPAQPAQPAQPVQPIENTMTDTKLTLEQLREQRLKYFSKK